MRAWKPFAWFYSWNRNDFIWHSHWGTFNVSRQWKPPTINTPSILIFIFNWRILNNTYSHAHYLLLCRPILLFAQWKMDHFNKTSNRDVKFGRNVFSRLLLLSTLRQIIILCSPTSSRRQLKFVQKVYRKSRSKEMERIQHINENGKEQKREDKNNTNKTANRTIKIKQYWCLHTRHSS